MADWRRGQAQIVEPNKCLEWRWVDFDNLPKPLFLPLRHFLQSNFVDDVKRQLTRRSKT
jgi:hypothetical protein